MQQVYSGKSDKEGYKNMTVYDDGSKIYFNDLQPSDELNRVFTECWNSLSLEKQIEINKRVEERRKQLKSDS